MLSKTVTFVGMINYNLSSIAGFHTLCALDDNNTEFALYFLEQWYLYFLTSILFFSSKLPLLFKI